MHARIEWVGAVRNLRFLTRGLQRLAHFPITEDLNSRPALKLRGDGLACRDSWTARRHSDGDAVGRPYQPAFAQKV